MRRFVEIEIYPHKAAVARSERVPRERGAEIRRKCLDLGGYACNCPQKVGGAGLSRLYVTQVKRELGRGSMALTHFLGRPQNILMACASDQRAVLVSGRTGARRWTHSP